MFPNVYRLGDEEWEVLREETLARLTAPRAIRTQQSQLVYAATESQRRSLRDGLTSLLVRISVSPEVDYDSGGSHLLRELIAPRSAGRSFINALAREGQLLKAASGGVNAVQGESFESFVAWLADMRSTTVKAERWPAPIMGTSWADLLETHGMPLAAMIASAGLHDRTVEPVERIINEAIMQWMENEWVQALRSVGANTKDQGTWVSQAVSSGAGRLVELSGNDSGAASSEYEANRLLAELSQRNVTLQRIADPGKGSANLIEVGAANSGDRLLIEVKRTNWDKISSTRRQSNLSAHLRELQERIGTGGYWNYEDPSVTPLLVLAYPKRPLDADLAHALEDQAEEASIAVLWLDTADLSDSTTLPDRLATILVE